MTSGYLPRGRARRGRQRPRDGVVDDVTRSPRPCPRLVQMARYGRQARQPRAICHRRHPAASTSITLPRVGRRAAATANGGCLIGTATNDSPRRLLLALACRRRSARQWRVASVKASISAPIEYFVVGADRSCIGRASLGGFALGTTKRNDAACGRAWRPSDHQFAFETARPPGRCGPEHDGVGRRSGRSQSPANRYVADRDILTLQATMRGSTPRRRERPSCRVFPRRAATSTPAETLAGSHEPERAPARLDGSTP